MPKVTFLPLNKTVEAEVGQTLLEVSEDHDIGLEHACGGVCACSTCHVIVQDGTDNNLEPQDDEEIDTMDKLVSTQTVHSRLGCQARVKGDVTVQIFNWPPREM
ncbi:2Fe-2S iron-sulfur cluster binding domain-containing protein [Candidatus Sumerlaeota bacterium]|nr:2Fe-2S iron-sulfur cluster binding domain-containing protein [Candidatus Sumerlaeota bacterium]